MDTGYTVQFYAAIRNRLNAEGIPWEECERLVEKIKEDIGPRPLSISDDRGREYTISFDPDIEKLHKDIELWKNSLKGEEE